MFCGMAKDGDEFGFKLEVVAEDYEVAAITCSGPSVDGKINCDIDISVEDEQSISFIVKDIYAKQFEKKGLFFGTIEIPLNDYIDEYTLMELGLDGNADMAVAIAVEGESKAKAAIMLDGEEAIAITIEAEIAKEIGDITVPTENVTEDSEQWLAGMSFDKFFENIENSSLPDELVQVIQMAIMSAMMGGMIY